ncbi:MAG TPA: enoyl-CoA hydratase/isomerase family protein [Acidimicrobiales bacterium]|nr:enoyl-CoA hydratase/isomerase family protein [Acidimicrobiales bacterium]
MRASFEQYSVAYDHVRMERTDGIIELTLHTDGGSLVWGDGPHTELGYCFADVGCDPDNRVVILTGAGDSFLASLDTSWVGAMDPDKWSKIYFHGRRLLLNLLEIEVPVIAAVNGPATVHAELALLSDIVLASETAVFSDAPHFRFGTVPGDGVHAIWPALFGPNRGRHLLLTAQRVPVDQALALGVVAEVLPPADLRDRAWELARQLAKKPPNVLRYTRSVLTAKWRAELVAALDHGLAMEGLGAYESWPTG